MEKQNWQIDFRPISAVILTHSFNSTWIYLCEPVQERLGQTFATSSLCKRVLAGKDLGLLMLNLEAHAQFRNINLCSVIKAGIQALQHRLRC